MSAQGQLRKKVIRHNNPKVLSVAGIGPKRTPKKKPSFNSGKRNCCLKLYVSKITKQVFERKETPQKKSLLKRLNPFDRMAGQNG